MVELMRHAVQQQQQQQSHWQQQDASNSNSNINRQMNWRKWQLRRGNSKTKVKLKCGRTTATLAARPTEGSKKRDSKISATTATGYVADNCNIDGALDIAATDDNNSNTANSNRVYNSNIRRSFTAATTARAASRKSTKMWLLLPILLIYACPGSEALRLTNGGNSLSKGVGANKEQLNIGLIAPHTNFGKREYLRSINNAVTGLTKTRGAKLTFLKDYSFEQKNIHFDMMSLTPSPTGKCCPSMLTHC